MQVPGIASKCGGCKHDLQYSCVSGSCLHLCVTQLPAQYSFYHRTVHAIPKDSCCGYFVYMNLRHNDSAHLRLSYTIMVECRWVELPTRKAKAYVGHLLYQHNKPWNPVDQFEWNSARPAWFLLPSYIDWELWHEHGVEPALPPPVGTLTRHSADKAYRHVPDGGWHAEHPHPDLRAPPDAAVAAAAAQVPVPAARWFHYGWVEVGGIIQMVGAPLAAKLKMADFKQAVNHINSNRPTWVRPEGIYNNLVCQNRRVEEPQPEVYVNAQVIMNASNALD